MADYKDYYKILGVTKTASDADIKKAFKTAARKYHPDLHPEADKAAMTEKFKDVNEAYEVLSDKQKRTVYDQVGSAGAQNFGGAGQRRSQSYGGNPFGGGRAGANQSYEFHNTGGFGAGDFSDFFQSIFGGMGGMGGGGGNPFANFGGGRAGRNPGPQAEEAELSLSLENAHKGGQMQLTLPSGRTANVKIPSGITDGAKLKLKGLGSRGGDLYITIKINPHPAFGLDGKDLSTKVIITPWLAATGGTAEIPTLDGVTKVKIPAMTHTGKKMKLSGKGLSAAGNLYVEFVIDLPPTLTKPQKEALQKLQEG